MSWFESKKKRIFQLERENRLLSKRIEQLVDLCDKKDSFFKELMADSLRHGSSLGGKHMADRKKYKQGKY